MQTVLDVVKHLFKTDIGCNVLFNIMWLILNDAVGLTALLVSIFLSVLKIFFLLSVALSFNSCV